MKVSQRERYISIAAGVVVALFVLDQFALSPWFSRWTAADTRIADQKDRLAQAKQTFDGGERANRRWAEISKRTLKADAPAAESQILNAARQWAQTAGLSLTSLKPERSEKEQGFMKITIRATANGSLSQITRFIDEAGDSPLPVRIADLQISAHKEGTDDLSMLIGLATIYQPVVSQTAGTEANR
ncbi:MAG: type 4a pilus biogenesis protein PilO [Phycisphaeraceae bacterium]